MRDFDWFTEIVKKSPFLAVGLYIFLIGPTGQAIFTNLSVTEPWRTICAIVGIAIIGWQGYLLWDEQRIGGTPLSVNEKKIVTPNKITLLSSPTQVTELIARPDGLELNFEDFQNPSISVRRLVSINELRQAIQNHKILVTQSPAKGPKYGRVQVASLKRWLYQTERHPDRSKLQNQISDLVKDIISQASQ